MRNILGICAALALSSAATINAHGAPKLSKFINSRLVLESIQIPGIKSGKSVFRGTCDANDIATTFRIREVEFSYQNFGTAVADPGCPGLTFNFLQIQPVQPSENKVSFRFSNIDLAKLINYGEIVLPGTCNVRTKGFFGNKETFLDCTFSNGIPGRIVYRVL